MKRRLFSIILPLAVIAGAAGTSGSAQAAGPESPKHGEVLFFEDFDRGEIPDPSVWKLCTYSHTAWGRYFSNTDGYSNVRIEDGYLVLTADKTDGRYTTGGIRTVKGFPAGTLVEVKARLKPVKGGFPAIWQMPVNGRPWPMSGEVDIMEWVQGKPQSVYQTVHTKHIHQTAGDAGFTKHTDGIDFAEEHVYAAARTAEAVIFYIDGVETSRYPNEHLEGRAGDLQFPFTLLDFDIILNYSFGGEFNGGGTWAGPIDDSELPGEMFIDWVKVTQIE